MRGVSSARMRELDRRAQEEFGIPEVLLMEHAGAAVASEGLRLLESGPARGRVLVLAGSGANGGDGLVAARHLDNRGVNVSVVLLADRDRVSGAARTNLKIVERLSIPLEEILSVPGWRRWRSGRGRGPFRLIVDALLGTGVSGRVREPVCSAIRWVNRQPCPVLSVDLPSGLSADQGTPCGAAVRATATVTCGLPKRGLLRRCAQAWTGRLVVADISLPRALTR
ncbi:MAG: NAD(P)H-hydrate epimerase [Candidatus Omnitrophica bacterium]|nr:NAD(P)H-hydrate epimerase [Candidatus Omnitrophota bacterium]